MDEKSSEAALRPRIAVVGSTMIDLITYTSRVPAEGETVEGDRFQMGFGGKGANQAVMARLLGVEVAMVNRLGDDIYGEMTLENFASFGVDTTYVRQVAGSSGVAPIWVEEGGANRIIIFPGANHRLSGAEARQALEELDDVAVAVGQLEIPQTVTAEAFAVARRQGVVTVLNPATAADLDPGLLSHTDWLIANEVEFASLVGCPPTHEAMRTYAAETGVHLVVTLGKRGAAVVAGDGEVVTVPTAIVDVVDTTGAGDAFVGAFSYGLAVELDEVDAIRLANLCATESVTRPGTQSSFPDADWCRKALARLVTA